MSAKYLIDNNRIFEAPGNDQTNTFFSQKNLHFQFFSSGREALFALLNQSRFLHSNKQVLLPAFLPEGILYPFQKMNWQITFYNLDQDGNPVWEEIENTPNTTIAILIHLFGVIRDADKFKNLLSPQTFLIEDFAHNSWSADFDFHNQPGHLLLFSPPKLIGLPDSAFWIENQKLNNKLNLQKASFTRFTYLFLRFLALLFDTIDYKWPFRFGHTPLKYLAILNQVLAYKTLMRFCHLPHKISNYSLHRLIRLDIAQINQKRISFAKRYVKGIDNQAIRLLSSSSPLAQIGFPIYAKNRSGLVNHLIQLGIRPTLFSEGWNNILKDKGELFTSSKDLMDSHLLLPLNHKLNMTDINSIIDAVNSFKS
jgi:hypothetical protein